MTTWHLTRIVQEIFDKANNKMKQERGEEASTHWLRHTGVSMEIERGRTPVR
jgi:hypothetical protein